MEKIDEILLHVKAWIFAAVYAVFAYFLVTNIKGIFGALKGKDGKWSVEEIAKAVIIGIIIYMVYIEANRLTEWHVFSDVSFMTFVAGLFFLAKMEAVVTLIRGHKENEK